MKSMLRSVTLLYLVFIIAVVQLGYFLVNKQTESLVLFTLVCVFTYLNTKNMILVLAISLVVVDLLYLVRKIPEGFEDASGVIPEVDSSMDPSMVDLSIDLPPVDLPVDLSTVDLSTINPPIDPMRGLTLDLSSIVMDASMNQKEPSKPLISQTSNKEPTRYLENAVKQMFKKTEPMTGDLEEVSTQSKEMSSIIDKIKKSSPEVAESMKMLNSIDIHEFNKLINNLNKIVNTISE